MQNGFTPAINKPVNGKLVMIIKPFPTFVAYAANQTLHRDHTIDNSKIYVS